MFLLLQMHLVQIYTIDGKDMYRLNSLCLDMHLEIGSVSQNEFGVFIQYYRASNCNIYLVA